MVAAKFCQFESSFFKQEVTATLTLLTVDCERSLCTLRSALLKLLRDVRIPLAANHKKRRSLGIASDFV
ncbi:MAG TPA: hypothetical protein V6D11_11055 [Waterburya sp.]